MNRPYDEYTVPLTLKADATVKKTVIGSIAESCIVKMMRSMEDGRRYSEKIPCKWCHLPLQKCTCLNPIHTTLAIYGCLLGYEKVSDEMKDEQLCKLVEVIGYLERLPVVENAPIFGVNLYEVGMADKVCGYFKELITGKGAVRKTLKRYTA